MGIYPSSSFFFFFFFFFFPPQLDKKLTNFFRIFLISVNSKFDQLSKFTIYLSNIYISAIHLKFNPKKKSSLLLSLLSLCLTSQPHFLAENNFYSILLYFSHLLRILFLPLIDSFYIPLYASLYFHHFFFHLSQLLFQFIN